MKGYKRPKHCTSMESKKRQMISLVLVAVLLFATIGMWWWFARVPVVTNEDATVPAVTRATKLPRELFADPRFQSLTAPDTALEIGPRGNPHPFEPFE